VRSSSSYNNSVVVTPGTGGPVSYYGKLKASGNKIVGSKTGSTAVQVRGVSLFWSNTDWGGDKFFTTNTVNAMVDSWKAEIIRVPMGYAATGANEYNGSYLDDKTGNMNRVKTAIDAAIAKDVYVIIDWHTHTSNSTDASAYFQEMASKYGSYDNVIFEIFNEPLNVSWSSIYSYATTVINTIRKYSNNLILVGTPNWDQKVNSVLSDPGTLADDNVAYVFHFYAAEHTLTSFQSNVDAVLSANKPVFVSEYGTVEADGNGSHSTANANAWHTYMDSKKISSCAWSVNDKNESASFFKPGFNMSSWTSTSSMNASGEYIYNKLTAYASSAPWRGGSGNGSSSASGDDDYGIPCGSYCYWPESGCVEIRTDPDALYGSTSIATCSAAISNCNNYGSGTYSNPTCGNTEVSGSRCKDTYGRDYFCEWETGCFAIDPAYAEPLGQTCSDLVYECYIYGSLYVNSTREGEYEFCNGTRASY